MAFVAVCVALVFAVLHFRGMPPEEAKTAATAPAVSQPASGVRDQAAAKLAAAQKEASAVSAALAGPPPSTSGDDGVPAFDVAHIEPTGEAVVAGRAAPGATVELLRNGVLHDRAVADRSGQFVMLPPRLPQGTYDLTLRSKQPDGAQATSRESVAVILDPTPKDRPASPNDRPVVALMSPEKATIVLSPPAVREPIATAKVVVEAVEVEPGGKFHTSGRARAGAAVRLYLNDSFVASATADADGRFAFTIKKGVVSGNYRVRLDEVEPKAGSVLARAEVPFNVPDAIVTASDPAPAMASKRPNTATAPQPQLAAAPQPKMAAASEQQMVSTPRPQPTVAPQQQLAATPQPPMAAAEATASPEKSSPSVVVVPKITTATVVRGDSLWRISRRTYGGGLRYAVIYEANRKQIRDPDLIYPGQIFVLPEQ